MKLAGWFPAYSHFGESYYLQPIAGVPCILLALSKLKNIVPKHSQIYETDLESVENLLTSEGYLVHRRSFDEFKKKPHSLLLQSTKADAILSFNPILPFIKEGTWKEALANFSSSHTGLLELTSVYPGHRQGKKKESFTRVVQPFASISRRYTLDDKKMSFPKDHIYWDLDEIESVGIYNPESLILANSLGRTLVSDGPYLKLSSIQKKNTHIKLVVSDVDGVLTDAGMYYSESGDQFKKFNAKDGIGIRKLQESGREIALLSTGVNENLIRERAKTLKIQRVAVGKFDKLGTLEAWKNELGLDWSEIAFIGDDINDLTVIDHVGLFACPKDAIPAVHERSHIILEKNGGEGCVREFIDQYILG